MVQARMDAKAFIFLCCRLIRRELRTYIFTNRERRVVQSFFNAQIETTNRSLGKIRSRVKLFHRLKNDIFLYLELYDRLLLDAVESSST